MCVKTFDHGSLEAQCEIEGGVGVADKFLTGSCMMTLLHLLALRMEWQVMRDRERARESMRVGVDGLLVCG